MTVRHESATGLAIEATEAVYADLILEALGGLRAGRQFPTVAWGCNDPAELRDVHRWLVEHGEQVSRDASAVLDRALRIEADEEFERE